LWFLNCCLGTITTLKNDKVAHNVGKISTGSLSLDIALGVGGLPKGRITEIYGPESSGKTTLALSVIAQAQKEGGKCCFIDVEHAIDPKWAEKIGVQVDKLYFSQPNSAEEALDIIENLVKSNQIDVIVLDSIAALAPRVELDANMGDSHIGLQARLMSHALRKLTAIIKKSNTLVILVNQLRMKIGVMFGNPEITSGGNSLKYYASVRLDIRKVGTIKNKEVIIGNQIRVKVVKNKVAQAYTVADFEIEFDKGITKQGEIIDLGVTLDIVKKTGAWYTYNDLQLGQGREKAKQYLVENPKISDEIETNIREKKQSELIHTTVEEIEHQEEEKPIEVTETQ